MQRQCSRCHEARPLEQFSSKRGGRGYDAYCKPCRKAYSAAYYQENRERLLPKQRAHDATRREAISVYRAGWYARNRAHTLAKVKQWVTAWRAANPDLAQIQQAARTAVRGAIARGELKRPDACEACGRVGRIEAAHHSYAPEYRLDVRWLCQRCHRRWDRNEPKGRRS